MGSVNVKETRRLLKSLLDRAEAGETITIARHGEIVARLVPPSRHPRQLPSLSRLRGSIKRKGRSLSRIVIDSRLDERA
ncbi:MAG: type II toxin-antitoxin system prevent-host-death family antitoxin [Nitrospira sp.]|nr:type II toxin-antitoxin system prevent-host-death family antitoxin [Nitrospira sp.]